MAAAGFAFLGVGGLISVTQKSHGLAAHVLLASPGVPETVGCAVILLAFVAANVYVARQSSRSTERLMELMANPATPPEARQVFAEVLLLRESRR